MHTTDIVFYGFGGENLLEWRKQDMKIDVKLYQVS